MIPRFPLVLGVIFSAASCLAGQLRRRQPGPGSRGCKSLISVDHAPSSGVMGDGVIDGRGGKKMLGSQFLGGSGRAGPRGRGPAGSAADRSQRLQQLHALPHHDQERSRRKHDFNHGD